MGDEVLVNSGVRLVRMSVPAPLRVRATTDLNECQLLLRAI
jgi:hypothetical protein